MPCGKIIYAILCFEEFQFSSVMSDSLWLHESQHARPPCSSPTPRVHSNSRPSSQWCHPAISSSVVPFSSCPQSLPASESFPTSQLFNCIHLSYAKMLDFLKIRCWNDIWFLNFYLFLKKDKIVRSKSHLDRYTFHPTEVYPLLAHEIK